jgi:formate hydrogenlyase subunit 4
MDVRRFVSVGGVKEKSITALAQDRWHAAHFVVSFRAKSRNLFSVVAVQKQVTQVNVPPAALITAITTT